MNYRAMRMVVPTMPIGLLVFGPSGVLHPT
jgi:hypothetical protein